MKYMCMYDSQEELNKRHVHQMWGKFTKYDNLTLTQ